MSETIRVIIADDHPLIRQGIRLVLSEASDIQVVGEARNGAEAIEIARHTPADMILLDMSMPGSCATEVVQALQEIAPTLKIMMVSAYDDAPMVQALIHAGIVGYLLKDEAEASLVSIIRIVHQGETWFSPDVVQAPAEWSTVNALTEREKDVLHAIAKGATNNEIARHFNLTDQTVRNYTSRVYEKLGIASRAEAIVWVLKNGLPHRPNEVTHAPQPHELLTGFVRF
jgi:DNA-binding NarL/FixJ family response regulator